MHTWSVLSLMSVSLETPGLSILKTILVRITKFTWSQDRCCGTSQPSSLMAGLRCSLENITTTSSFTSSPAAGTGGGEVPYPGIRETLRRGGSKLVIVGFFFFIFSWFVSQLEWGKYSNIPTKKISFLNLKVYSKCVLFFLLFSSSFYSYKYIFLRNG